MTVDTTIATENLADLLGGYDRPRLEALMIDHWTEVAQHKDIMKLDPFFERYLEREKKGELHVVIVRAEGVIVAYSVHFLMPTNMHYRGLRCAEDDVHYVVPVLRKTGLHEAMRRFALEDMKKKGIQYVTARTKIEHGHDNVLRRIGFTPLDQVYSLNLTKWQS